MKLLKFRGYYFVVLAIVFIILHYGVVAYVHINFVHKGADFYEHLFSLKHLTINEVLNRVFTTFFILFFGITSMIYYDRLQKAHDEISNRYKKLNEEVELQKRFVTTVVDCSPVALFVIDKNHRVLFWNKACEILTGIKRDEILNTDDHLKAFSTEKRPLLADCVINQDFTGCELVYNGFGKSKLSENGVYGEKLFENLGGKVRYVVFDATPIYDAKNEIIAAVETILDITDTKKLINDLDEKERILSTLINSTAAAIFIYDEKGFKFCNTMCEKITGFSIDELMNMNFYDVVHPDMKEIVKERGLKRLKEEKVVNRYEVKLLTKSGEIKWIDFTSEIMDYKGKKMAIGTAYDITERKKLEEAFTHSQKLEAIGRLSAGIAHDFNNILTGIMGYATFVEMMAEDEKIKESAKHILTLMEKAADLTKGLLAFSRKQVFKLKNTELNDFISGLTKLIKRMVGEDIDVKLCLSKERLVSKIDRAHMESVILNLITNARDAMPEGGVLMIETYLYKPDDFFKKKYNYDNNGSFGVIVVSDTGVGIPDEIKDKIFEPFFTTKEKGKGTGLGLASVYGTVKQHGGYINVYSELGNGTTFKIYLPLTDEPVSEGDVFTSIENLTGEGTILLVEDDDSVRDISKEWLERFGYKVIEAKNGLDGLNKFKEHGEKIQLALIDVVMPVMNGKECYENMIKIKSDIKVIFMSGYTENFIHKKGVLTEGVNFISKPITPLELAKKIKEVLNS